MDFQHQKNHHQIQQQRKWTFEIMKKKEFSDLPYIANHHQHWKMETNHKIITVYSDIGYKESSSSLLLFSKTHTHTHT